MGKKEVLAKGTTSVKGPEMGTRLMCSRNNKKASIGEQKGAIGK